jgi:hypothetical protein
MLFTDQFIWVKKATQTVSYINTCVQIRRFFHYSTRWPDNLLYVWCNIESTWNQITGLCIDRPCLAGLQKGLQLRLHAEPCQTGCGGAAPDMELPVELRTASTSEVEPRMSGSARLHCPFPSPPRVGPAGSVGRRKTAGRGEARLGQREADRGGQSGGPVDVDGLDRNEWGWMDKERRWKKKKRGGKRK